ncbi:MAG: hypothetical protein FJW27_00435 [Acidimicrobiia bacterium]|nr:hypothetical protein [Acidimicrobiia bacterium]
MLSFQTASPFRMDKRRVEAALTLTTGQSVRGSLFLADSTIVGDGPERVDDLLNQTRGFFPFERMEDGQRRVVLYSVDHVTLARLFHDGAREVPGYEVARVRAVSLVLTGGERVSGRIRVYQPDGRNRVSDWSQEPAVFRYLETEQGTLLININHVVEIIELERPRASRPQLTNCSNRCAPWAHRISTSASGRRRLFERTGTCSPCRPPFRP